MTVNFSLWWQFLHVNSLIYDESVEFTSLVIQGIENLPCIKCVKHFNNYVKPINIVSNSKFLFNLHNSINTRTNKPMFKWQNISTTYGNKNEEQLFDLNWKFICMIFMTSPKRHNLVKYYRELLKFYNYDIMVDVSKLLSNQRQFYLYASYRKLGGNKTMDEIAYSS